MRWKGRSHGGAGTGGTQGGDSVSLASAGSCVRAAVTRAVSGNLLAQSAERLAGSRGAKAIMTSRPAREAARQALAGCAPSMVVR